MGLRIIYGKSGSGKSEYCFKEIAQAYKKRKKDIYYNTRAILFYSRKKINGAIDAKAV